MHEFWGQKHSFYQVVTDGGQIREQKLILSQFSRLGVQQQAALVSAEHVSSPASGGYRAVSSHGLPSVLEHPLSLSFFIKKFLLKYG